MGGLVLHNLKKTKGQFISFGIVMLITALILNTALVLLFQTGKAYDKRFDELNTADLSVSVPAAAADDALSDEIAALDGIAAVERHDALFASAALQEFQGSEFTMNTYFYRLSDARTISRLTVEEESGSRDAAGAYIPLYLSELGGYKTGETVRYILNGTEYSFPVNGTVSEMQYGNYGTGFIGLFLTDKSYEALAGNSDFTAVSEYAVKTENGADTAEVRSSLSGLLRERNIPALSLLDRETSRSSRTMLSDMIVLFLAVFALLVLTVSIFLARFRIRQTIGEEIGEMGVLKGIGYTGGMLICCQVIPYGAVCGMGLLLGTAVSCALVPAAANVLAVQSGFSYRPVFDLKAACITVFVILAAVLLFTVLAAGKIRKLEPIHAIRGIDPSGTAAKNRFPLDTAKGSVRQNLILKQMCSSAGRNVLLFAVTFVMMILLGFTGVLFYNVNIRPQNFLTTLSEELPDIRVQSDAAHFDGLKAKIAADGIRAVEYGTAAAEYAGGSIPVIVCEDYALPENDICYAGAHPENGNEIAVGSKFDGEYRIGDAFSLTLNGTSHAYRISGFIQSVNNSGLIAELTGAGYGKLSGTPLYMLNLYADGRDVDGYVEKLSSEYADDTVSVSNAAKETKAMQALYSLVITVVSALLFVMTVLIVLLILYVIMRSMTASLKTDFGICKAMGFTSRQLILQTVGSIAPVVLIGSVLSAVLGIRYLPAMFRGIFSVIGVQKNNFEIPAAVLLLTAVILTAVNLVIGTLLCRPIRKITAYSLIREG